MLHVNSPRVTVEYALERFGNIWFSVKCLGVWPKRDYQRRNMAGIFWRVEGQNHEAVMPMRLQPVTFRAHIHTASRPKLTPLVNAIKKLGEKYHGQPLQSG